MINNYVITNDNTTFVDKLQYLQQELKHHKINDNAHSDNRKRNDQQENVIQYYEYQCITLVKQGNYMVSYEFN